MISVDRFQAGSNLTSEYIDQLARAIKELQGLAVTGVQYPLVRSSAGTLSSLPGDAIVLVKNNSGAARSKFDVLVLGDPVVLPTENLSAFDSRVMFLGETPSEASDNLTQPFAILLEPAAIGATVKAMIQGVTPCRVYVAADAEESTKAGLVDESYALAAGAKGARILWKESGTGTKRAVVALGFGTGEDDGSFWAEIDGYELEDALKWKYSWHEVYKQTAGNGLYAFQFLYGGRSGTTTDNPARNTIENCNSAGAGGMGNGVAYPSLPGDFCLQPCPGGVVVRMWATPVDSGGTEYWFQYENGVDGACGDT